MPSSKIIAPYLHTIDAIVCRFNRERSRLEVLLNIRDKEPFKSLPALPGIVVNGDSMDDDLDSALNRLFTSRKVGLKPLYYEQVGTVGSKNRDPRGWSSSTFYLVIVDSNCSPLEGSYFEDFHKCVNSIVNLPFDHNDLCKKVNERLVSKSLYSNLPMMFLGKEVTFTDILDITSIVLGRDISKGSMGGRFKKMIDDGYLIDTNKVISKKGRPGHQLKINRTPSKIYLFDKSFNR